MGPPRWALALATLAASCGWGCAGSPVTPADSALLGTETDLQTACVQDHRGDAGAIDACRAGVRKEFDAIWASRFDGGGQ
jgi:hypothetical protein